MKQEEHNKKRSEFWKLESQLIDKIADSGNLELMDLFLNWQSLRLELNQNSVKTMEELFEKIPKDTEEKEDGIGINFQLKHKMCMTCAHRGHIKESHPCFSCDSKCNYVIHRDYRK